MYTPYDTKLGHDPRTASIDGVHWTLAAPGRIIPRNGLPPDAAVALRKHLVHLKAQESDPHAARLIGERIKEVDRYMAAKQFRAASKRRVSLVLLKRKMQAFLFDAGVLGDEQGPRRSDLSEEGRW